MKKFLVLSFLCFFIFLLLDNYLETIRHVDNVDKAIEKSQNFLGKSDLYLNTFGEDNFCKNSSNYLNDYCLYKKIDYSIDFVYIKNEIYFNGLNPELQNSINEADEFLRDLTLELKNASIDSSYLDYSSPKGDFAFDLYCILTSLYRDEKMFEKINSSLNDYGWINPSESDRFRRITDESWCIKVLIEFNASENIIKHLIKLKQYQFYDFPRFEDTNVTEEKQNLRRTLAAIHILMVISDAEKNGYDISEYNDFKNELINFVLKSTESTKNIEIEHAALYFLSEIGFEDKQIMKEIALEILKKQDDDGGWHYEGLDDKYKYRILLASRCLLALNQYKIVYLLK